MNKSDVLSNLYSLYKETEDDLYQELIDKALMGEYEKHTEFYSSLLDRYNQFVISMRNKSFIKNFKRLSYKLDTIEDYYNLLTVISSEITHLLIEKKYRTIKLSEVGYYELLDKLNLKSFDSVDDLEREYEETYKYLTDRYSVLEGVKDVFN